MVNDTSSDTGDDTGEYECKEEQIVSAASLAGEASGISCSTTSTAFLFLVIVMSTIIIATRLRGKKVTCKL